MAPRPSARVGLLHSFFRLRLQQRSDLARNIRVDPAALADTDVGDGPIVCHINVGELAVEAAVGSQRCAPAGRLVVVDHPRDIRGHRILHERGERHQEVDRNPIGLERASHIDHVVRTLRVPHQDERAGVAGGFLTLDGKRALKTLLSANKRLNTAYVLKESFGQLWSYEPEGWARRFFENLRAGLKWQRLKPYEKFAEMIDRHWDGIAAYCRPENKVSLGFVEGLNN